MKKLERMNTNIRGITLIALVVTIIVLLILAGIAINLTIGNNGLFVRAQNAVNIWEGESKKEEKKLEEFINEIDKNNSNELKKEEFSIFIPDVDYENKLISTNRGSKICNT